MISVVIPLYNKEASIKQSLMSVLSQSYQDFEVVIVDDGSTDNSVAKVEEIQDSRIRLIRQENGGPSKARNTGVKNAKGDWILFLDADDELLPEALCIFDAKMKQNPSYSFFCAPFYEQNKESVKLAYNYKEGVIKNPFKAHCFGRLFSRAGSFICKTEICKANLFDERMRRYEDFEWLFRIYNQIIIYVFNTPVLKMNLKYCSASHARNDIKEDFMGYLDFKGKSFWERMALYFLYLGEREYYTEQCQKLYPWLYKRYDRLLIYKIVRCIKRIK